MFILDDLCNDLKPIISIIKFILKLIQWIVPIVLIILGTIDLVKAVISQKDEDIKKNQKILLKRAVAALIIFLIPLLVSIIMGWVGSDSWKTCWNNTSGNLNNIFNSNGTIY